MLNTFDWSVIFRFKNKKNRQVNDVLLIKL